MCGIAGLVASHKGRRSYYKIIEAMNAVQHHRGPDGNGVWPSQDQKVFFGHVRLAIIDLSEQAAQPMCSNDGRYVITYNGEIYNYKELRKLCEEEGSVFRSQSDTEVVLECYRHWGAGAFSKFTGMWALAIYDSKKNQLLLSRDRFAIKPLYYGFAEGDLYFASEPKALREAHPAFNEIDEVTTQLFIEYGYLERDNWTFFKHIKRFPHAHYAVINLQQPIQSLSFERYWSPPTEMRKIKMVDAAQELRGLIDKSIELHMRSDVPVGACLSGGIDSSVIVCAGSRHTDQAFNTFTTHYPNYRDIDESEWAKRIIKHVGANAVFTEPTYKSFMDNLDHLLFHQDEPFGSTSIFAQYTVFKKIGDSNVKVVLDGQGPDELLCGYHGFVDYYLQSLLKQGSLVECLLESRALSQNIGHGLSISSIVKHSLLRRRNKPMGHYSSGLPDFNAEFVDSLESRLQRLNLPASDFEQTLTNLVCETNIPQLLRYEDRNSMAFSVESRVPFLEEGIVDFCLSLPATLRVHRGYTKAVLREAIKGLIPEKVRTRIDKLGFPAPEIQWLKQGFDVEVQAACSKEWREIIVDKWRDQVNEKAYLKHAGDFGDRNFISPRDLKKESLSKLESGAEVVTHGSNELLTSTPHSADAVVMLTWSDWRTEMRSNRYNYAIRFADDMPVIFVQPDLLDERYIFENSGTPNITILHVYQNYGDKQNSLLTKALGELNIVRPLYWVWNVNFSDYLCRRYTPMVVYHATEDYFSMDSPMNFDSECYVDLREKVVRLGQEIDLLISVSKGVEDNFLQNISYDGASLVVQNGCDYKFYAPSLQKIEERLASGNVKRVFYQGNISEKINFDLLRDVACLMPDWTFIFCGKVGRVDGWSGVKGLPNVEYRGICTPEELKEEAYQATVGIIPFVEQDWIVKRSLPLKAYEYLACGLPVVSTPIDSLQEMACEGISFAISADEFVAKIREAAQKVGDKALLQGRLKAAELQDYDAKYKRVKNHIHENFNVKRTFDCPKKLNILVLYEPGSNFVGAITDHLGSFKEFSRHHISYSSGSRNLECKLDLSLYDVVILHYAIRVSVDYGEWTISESYTKALQEYEGYKVLFMQDEYDTTNVAKGWIRKLGIHAVFTCVPQEYVNNVYPALEFPGVEFVTNLTGYVTEQSRYAKFIMPSTERKKLIGYRGRQLPFWYGDLGQEKYQIGKKMAQVCLERNIEVDIETDDAKRIYGDAWLSFLGSAKATLGTESGANIFDFTGELSARITQAMQKNPGLTYEEVFDKFLRPHEGLVKMNQISPKIFEAISLHTALVLFEGDYSGVVKPDLHFIPLKKDFSNIDEVLDKLQDNAYLQMLTERAYQEVIASGKFSYRAFIEDLDDFLVSRVKPKSRVEFVLAYVAYRPIESRDIVNPKESKEVFSLPSPDFLFYDSQQRYGSVSFKSKSDLNAELYCQALNTVGGVSVGDELHLCAQKGGFLKVRARLNLIIFLPMCRFIKMLIVRFLPYKFVYGLYVYLDRIFPALGVFLRKQRRKYIALQLLKSITSKSLVSNVAEQQGVAEESGLSGISKGKLLILRLYRGIDKLVPPLGSLVRFVVTKYRSAVS